MNTCYIFGAADGLPKSFKKDPDDLVIAADGGLLHLKNLNNEPDIILGDFDSLGYIPTGKEVIIHPTKKDYTDSLLAVKTGFERGFKVFVIYGCMGKRPDHTLANMQILSYVSKNKGIAFLCDSTFTATAITDRSLKFKKEATGNISVFCAQEKCSGVTLMNLLYPLSNAELHSDFPLGVSNEFIGKEACISVKEGTLIIIWQGNPNDLVLN